MIIALEGVDGCGKTTQAKRLADRITARLWKFPVKNSPTGKLIYGALEGNWIDPLVFQSLQVVNRLEVMAAIEATSEHQDVVFDRYWQSAYAYGMTDGLDGDYLIDIHRRLVRPDLNILLDVDIENSRQRRAGRAEDRYERDNDLLGTVIKNYRRLWAVRLLPRWTVIDARGDEDTTASLIDEAIERRRAHG